MSFTANVTARHPQATAMLLEECVTSATDIEQFCGSGNVDVGRRQDNDCDLRWVHVRTPQGLAEACFGNWIVRDSGGNLSVLDQGAFLTLWASTTTQDSDALWERIGRRPLTPTEVSLIETFPAR